MCVLYNDAPEKKIVEDAQGPNMARTIPCNASLLFLKIHTTKYFINISENPESKQLDYCSLFITGRQYVFEKF